MSDEKFTLIISNKHAFFFKKINEKSIDLIANYDPEASRKVRLDDVIDWLISGHKSGDKAQ